MNLQNKMEKFSKKNYFRSVNSPSSLLTSWTTGPHPDLSWKTAAMAKKIKKSVGNVLCGSKKGSIFAADFAAHVLLTVDAHALVKSRV